MQAEKRRPRYEEVSDRLLTERTLAGDEDAFAILVQRYRRLLFQVAHNRCVDETRRKRMWSSSKVEKEGETNEVSEIALLLDKQPVRPVWTIRGIDKHCEADGWTLSLASGTIFLHIVRVSRLCC